MGKPLAVVVPEGRVHSDAADGAPRDAARAVGEHGANEVEAQCGGELIRLVLRVAEPRAGAHHGPSVRLCAQGPDYGPAPQTGNGAAPPPLYRVRTPHRVPR